MLCFSRQIIPRNVAKNSTLHRPKINNPKDYFIMYKPNKRSPRHYACHSNDIYTGLGYDYHNGTILSKTLSPVILKNQKNKILLNNIERIICYLIDSVKQIKLHFMFSLDKNDINLN